MIDNHSSVPVLNHPHSVIYEKWKRYGHHFAEYASEFLGTAVLVFFVIAVVTLMFGASSPVLALLPAVKARLLIAGLLIGSVVFLISISPPGKLSGAHINPAVTFGFYLLGKMHLKDTIGYVASQMVGAIAGTMLGQLTFGHFARAVNNAALEPGPHIGGAQALAGEVATTFVLTLLIYTFVSHKTLLAWTPSACIPVISILIFLDGNVSGAGFNPARWFGPAFSLHLWNLSWVYLLGPLIGAALAAGVQRTGILAHPLPFTGKLCHDSRYRSIFKHDQLSSKLPTSMEPERG